MDLRGVGVRGDPESASSTAKRCLRPDALKGEMRSDLEGDFGALLEEDDFDLKIRALFAYLV